MLKPLKSWNPLWANVEPWVYLAGLARRAPRWRDKAWVLFADPAWAPGKGKASATELQQLYEKVSADRLESRLGSRATAYVFVQFVIVLGTSAYYLNHTGDYPLGLQTAFIAWAFLSLSALGALCDRKQWAPALEAGRLVLGIGAVAFMAWSRRLARS